MSGWGLRDKVSALRKVTIWNGEPTYWAGDVKASYYIGPLSPRRDTPATRAAQRLGNFPNIDRPACSRVATRRVCPSDLP